MSSLKFWHGKNVFITGATGFVGKALVEKLLREFGDDCGTIYLLVRARMVRSRKPGVPDENRGVDERLRSEIYDSQLFDTLRATRRDFETLFFQKVKPIAGELSRQGATSIVDDHNDLVRTRLSYRSTTIAA